MRNRNNAFCKQLAYIVIDEAHLIWSWRSFQKEYGMIGHLKSTFPKVPTLALLATVTPNVLEYVRESLQLRAPARLYKESLDRPNLTYLVSEIKKPGFEELDFIVSPCIAAFTIPKTMIIIDNIDTAGQLELYLQSRLSSRLQTKSRLLIQTFLANLTVDTRSIFLKDFRTRNTRIWICTKCTGMGLNLRDIEHVYQWKLSDFIMFPELVQRLGRAGRDIRINAVALVFVESRHCLPISDNDLVDTQFANAKQPVSVNNRQDVQG